MIEFNAFGRKFRIKGNKVMWTNIGSEEFEPLNYVYVGEYDLKRNKWLEKASITGFSVGKETITLFKKHRFYTMYGWNKKSEEWDNFWIEPVKDNWDAIVEELERNSVDIGTEIKGLQVIGNELVVFT